MENLEFDIDPAIDSRFGDIITDAYKAEDLDYDLGDFNKDSLKLGKNFWPGPLTIIVPIKKAAKLSRLATAGLDTVALRVPDNSIAKKLIEISNKPVAAPSANPSGRLSPTTAEHVQNNLGSSIKTILDGGQTKLGIESTIVACIKNKCYLVRSGAITNDIIEKIIGTRLLTLTEKNNPIGPGNLRSHYSPLLPIRINAKQVLPDEALLAFGKDFPLGASITLNLSKNSNLREAASNFFAMLHKLDSTNTNSIAVSPIPNIGLGIAINDRLKRASE